MRPRRKRPRQLLDFVAAHRGESGIVYCLSRRRPKRSRAFLAARASGRSPITPAWTTARARRHQNAFMQRGRRGDGRDHRLRHGHRQARRALRRPRRPAGAASRPTTRRSAAPAATASPPRRLRCSAWATSACAGCRSRRAPPDEQKRVDRQRLDALVALCESPRCRRQTLLRLFRRDRRALRQLRPLPRRRGGGRRHDRGAEGDVGDLRTGERFGTEHLVDLLLRRGDRGDRKFGHDTLRDLRRGKEPPQPVVRDLSASSMPMASLPGTSPATDGGPCSRPAARAHRKATSTPPRRR